MARGVVVSAFTSQQKQSRDMRVWLMGDSKLGISMNIKTNVTNSRTPNLDIAVNMWPNVPPNSVLTC